MSGEACVANIGPGERRKRVALAVVSLGVSAAATLALVVSGAPRAWRLGLFFPLWAAALGYFQAREKT
jgi:hypothetical protein